MTFTLILILHAACVEK